METIKEQDAQKLQQEQSKEHPHNLRLSIKSALTSKQWLNAFKKLAKTAITKD